MSHHVVSLRCIDRGSATIFVYIFINVLLVNTPDADGIGDRGKFKSVASWRVIIFVNL
jgi:hypothetical protein